MAKVLGETYVKGILLRPHRVMSMETLDITIASKHPNYRHDKFYAKIQYLLVWFKRVIYVITYNVNIQISHIHV